MLCDKRQKTVDFRTIVQIENPPFVIEPCERMLFVGSCFADRIGQRFQEERFPVVVNPYGVMYNPASVMHTVERGVGSEEWGVTTSSTFSTAVLTLGTNHVYIEKATGEIVDNCRKRPQRLFEERELTVEECADYLKKTITLLRQYYPDIRVVLTVSPIRYAKYGYHGSQLSKATLLLAIDKVLGDASLTQHPLSNTPYLCYFPAYEIVNDELRDYRFYDQDMLHPSNQTVEYIWERLVDSCFSDAAKQYLREWKPVKEALRHRPFNPDSQEYRDFMNKTQEKLHRISEKYPTFAG